MAQADVKSKPGGVLVQKPKANVYTVMLILSFVAILIGCLFLWLEINEYQGDIRAESAALAPAVHSALESMPLRI